MGFRFRVTGTSRAKNDRRELGRAPSRSKIRPSYWGAVSGSGGDFPANGVLTFASRGTSAKEASCTLPDIEHLVCTTILNDFLVRYPA
jgi:hypothetical protein